LYRLSSNKITSKGANILFDTLKNNQISIETAYIDGNDLDDECMASLGELINNNKTIKEIRLSGNYFKNGRITDRGIEIFSQYLIGNKNLIYLSLSYNSMITGSSVPIFEEILKNSKLETLELYGTSIISQQHGLFILAAINSLINGKYKIELVYG